MTTPKTYHIVAEGKDKNTPTKPQRAYILLPDVFYKLESAQAALEKYSLEAINKFLCLENTRDFEKHPCSIRFTANLRGYKKELSWWVGIVTTEHLKL